MTGNTKTENGIVRFDRRGADRGRTLTPGEIEEQRFVQEAMERYELFQREVEREDRRRLWRGVRWGLSWTAAIVFLIWLVLSRHG